MIEQDVCQLSFGILQKCLNRPLRQCRKGVVCGSKYRKVRCFIAQSRIKSGCLESRNKRGKPPVSNRCLNNVAFWQHHCVNDVNDTVAAHNVCCNDVCFLDHDAVCCVKLYPFAIKCHCIRLGYHICCHQVTRYNMIQENIFEISFRVLKKGCDCSHGKLQKGIICWCEYGERPLPRERFRQTGGINSCKKGRK